MKQWVYTNKTTTLLVNAIDYLILTRKESDMKYKGVFLVQKHRIYLGYKKCPRDQEKIPVKNSN